MIRLTKKTKQQQQKSTSEVTANSNLSSIHFADQMSTKRLQLENKQNKVSGSNLNRC